MTVTAPTTSLLSRPHHDGSYVVEQPGELGDTVVARIRVPRVAGVDGVKLAYFADAEARFGEVEIDQETDTEVWWRATFPAENPVVRYRWLLERDGSHLWLNGLGISDHDTTDADDFVIAVGGTGPDWHLSSVVYEIFPDRFATSGLDVQAPEWAVKRAWDEAPAQSDTRHEWFGGDLAGIEQHLDHIESLGASVVYLTPIFPAGSTHRYDATSFARIDPLLGGDEAFASLVKAAHGRGMRVLGDLTTNHVGRRHEWFTRAQDDAASPEHGFFYFDESLPAGYACWWNVPDLPKLNWGSADLAARMHGVARHWLEHPFDADGWRIDVANQTGRYRSDDLNHEVQRGLRAAVGPDKLLVAEHYYDARADLAARGWHGVMNYAGFMRPTWGWLGEDPELLTRHLVFPSPGSSFDAMRAFRAGTPWPSVLHSWALVDSHDSARFRTVTGSREKHVVGIGLQMTTPGVPMVFAGDEIGLEGAWGEQARRTMPWDTPETWDSALLAAYRELIALRRSSSALATGGIRYAHVSPDTVAYLRESADERLLCLAARAAHDPIRLPLAELGCSELEPLHGGDAALSGTDAVLPADGPAFHAWRLQ